jgi:hypothetical protein
MDLVNEIKLAWGWTGINPVKIVAENEFGNLIIRDANDSFWRLCPEDVYCSLIANDKAELNQLLAAPEFVEDWLMESLVVAAEETLGKLEPGKKYHLATPGALGGEYAPSNFVLVSQTEQIRLSGDVGNQIKNLPDGTSIDLKVVE